MRLSTCPHTDPDLKMSIPCRRGTLETLKAVGDRDEVETLADVIEGLRAVGPTSTLSTTPETRCGVGSAVWCDAGWVGAA